MFVASWLFAPNMASMRIEAVSEPWFVSPAESSLALRLRGLETRGESICDAS